MTEHVHKDLIIAWANGAIIERFDAGWFYEDPNPTWDTHGIYRIQPEKVVSSKTLTKLKHHEVREFVNELTSTAVTYHAHGMLREKILQVVSKHITHLVEHFPGDRPF